VDDHARQAPSGFLALVHAHRRRRLHPHFSTSDNTTQTFLAYFAEVEPSGPPAWTSIPRWYLVTLDDHAVLPAGQEFMATRMRAHTEAVHSTHDVVISHRVAVDRIVLEAAAHGLTRPTPSGSSGVNEHTNDWHRRLSACVSRFEDEPSVVTSSRSAHSGT
jgi:hypothetical protein